MHAMTSPEELVEFLARQGIRTKTYTHAPVFTVEESRRLRGDLPGGHCKSLFLKDKKEHLFLVVALEDKRIDLKALRKTVGAHQGLSFASPERLKEVLGVTPGAVTPFAIFNDTDALVRVVLDRAMLRVSPLNYHPLSNDRTTAIAPEDLLVFLEKRAHEPLLVDF